MKTNLSVVCRKRYSEGLRRCSSFVMSLLLCYCSGAVADDTELFFSAENRPPNILFVLDDSYSMKTVDNPATGQTRMDALKSAMSTLVAQLDGVNAGIMTFHRFVELTSPVQSIDIPANRQILLDAIDAMAIKTDQSLWGTATQDALWDGRSYFRGELSGPAEAYPSPLDHECQANHIILMSDGLPWYRDGPRVVQDVESAIAPDRCADVSALTSYGVCGQEIGEHLFTADISNTVNGINNVITHTIGFGQAIAGDWLPSISGNTRQADGTYAGGFGRHFDVTSSEALLTAFNSIIDGIGSTFAAPSVALNSFNESRHRDEIYYAQFESSSRIRWNGNIKKYRLNEVTDATTGETDTVIVDADGIPLVDDAGQIISTSRSFWSEIPDGASVPAGGFAHRLPDYDQRDWYTDYNSTVPVKVEFNDPDLNNKLPVASLGAADEAERDTLVQWALGFDVEGFDEAVAAAASASEAVTTEASIAAAEAAADAAVLLQAAEAELTTARAVAESAALAADNAQAAADAAEANNADNAMILIVEAGIAQQESAAADAAAEAADIAVAVAAAAAADARAAANQAASEASMATVAALEASDENHHFVADSLHNSPALLSYWSENNAADRGEILYAPNNMGVLHAIDPETGVELWSYTPEEHLGNIKTYFENNPGPVRAYGLDGQFTFHTTRAEREGYDVWVDNAWLYLTERRGGNRVYALDVSNGLRDRGGDDPFSVLWKITGGDIDTPVYDRDGDGRNDFADLAQTWSKPEVVSIAGKELLMFSGGYNADIYDDVNLDYSALTVPADSHGNVVYFVDPETGELEWSVGNGTQHDLNLPLNHSLPSTPVPVDIDVDGSIDLMFFVDVGGDVWRVDFDSEAESTDELHLSGGKIAELSPAGESLRFFNPVDVVLSGTNFSTAHYSLVTGSGIRTSPLFIEPHLNRLYAIKDRWVQRAPFRLDDDGNEVPDYRYVTGVTGNHRIISADDNVLQNVSDAADTVSDNFGFFRIFEPGEKILQPTLVHNNLIFANSYVPPALQGGANCNFDIGISRLHITSLLDGENSIPPGFGGDFIVVGEGLLSGGQIVDTGHADAPFFLIDKNVLTLKELTAPNDNEVFRRFRRTGWVELDDY